MPVVQRCGARFGSALLAAALLLFGACGGGSGPAPDDSTLVVVRRATLNVAAGSEERISADRLVIANAARIDGSLVIVPAASGRSEGFELVVENGDLVVGGSVKILSGEPAAMRQAASRGHGRRADSQTAGPQKDLHVTAVNGDLYLGPDSSFEAGRGEPGATLVVTRPESARAVDGGRGGDVVISARLIHVQRRVHITGDGSTVLNGPAFFLGYGGKGGSIEVDDSQFPNTLPAQLMFEAGKGGPSGRLRLAGTIELPAVDGIVDARGWRIDNILLGNGGWGGDVVWAVGDRHLFEGLSEVTLRSGDGGNGAGHGGRGGLVRYLSGKVINGGAMPRASAVFAMSGNGGDLDATFINGGEQSPVRIYVDPSIGPPSGGWGGPIVARANAGRSAMGDPNIAVDGQAGGNLRVWYGDGGNVTSALVYPRGGGGAGGGLSDARGHDKIVDPVDFVHPLAGGRGGDAAGFCSADNQRAGGRGGDSGDIEVRFGNGGNGPQPGAAGVLDYSWIRFAAPGRGGSGRPPGANGAPGRVEMQPGAGGRHPSDPGRVGANTVVTGAKVVDLVPEPAECDQPIDDRELGPWSETLRHSLVSVSGTGSQTSSRVYSKSCGATELLPVDDPVNPGRTFPTSRCTTTTSSIDVAGSTTSTEHTSQCLHAGIDGGKGQSTVRSLRFDAHTGQTTETTTTTDGPCPAAFAYRSRGRYGGSGFCAVNPVNGERSLVYSDGPVYRWGWQRTNGSASTTEDNEYSCTNCTPSLSCRCASDGPAHLALRCEPG